MQQLIRDIVFLISKDVKELIPLSFEKKYYEKMKYSNKNTILDSSVEVLKETISFEVAFVHVICFFMAKKVKVKKYTDLLKRIDSDKIYSWYKINDNKFVSKLDEIELSPSELYMLINRHDTFVDKSIKKKLGQFYTPVTIAKKMVVEIKDELKNLSDDELLIDPACGTGVFIVETIRLMSKFKTTQQLCTFVRKNMFAYDVNPFSVIATKFNVINTLVDVAFSKNVGSIYEYIDLVFENIKWKNTITEEEKHCFSVILGNPPYFKLDSESMNDIVGYDDIIYGQPNICSLFMYWSLCHLKPEGIMSFIIPQSIRSGLYFKKLREKIMNYRIKSLLHIDSRQRVFDRAEQAVLIISLKKAPIRNTKTKLMFVDGNQNKITEFTIDRKKLIMGNESDFMFVINRHKEMYDILEKINQNSFTLSDDESTYKFSNGLFVWNQHKDILEDTNKFGIPIIYGGSIQPLDFDFIESWQNQERKSFAKITKKTQPFVMNGKRLLVQRTTNFEKEIRLKACLISDGFLERYDKYYLENHVNFLCNIHNKDDLISDDIMLFFLGLLNSKLVNYIFVSKSGNTQVSANELNLLPFPKNRNNEISQFVKKHIHDLKQHQNELDHIVCQAYGLSQEEIDVITNI